MSKVNNIKVLKDLEFKYGIQFLRQEPQSWNRKSRFYPENDSVFWKHEGQFEGVIVVPRRHIHPDPECYEVTLSNSWEIDRIGNICLLKELKKLKL